MIPDYSFSWSPPVYSLDDEPYLKNTYNIVTQDHSQNFARCAKWTPDGAMFMAQCEDRSLQLFNPYATPNEGKPQLLMRQAAPILDFTWFPTASPNDLASFCFLASVRECPVKLLDASDGRLRASYPIIDHREQFVAPQSMTFNNNATKIYCGHENAIEVFDVSQPGEGVRLYTTPSKKSKDGLKGIISALAFSPSLGTQDDAFYAAGTLNPTLSNLALFSESQGDVPVMFLGGGARASITQLRFNPMKPHLLYAAYRRRNVIYAWDLRSDFNMPIEKYVFRHIPTTNQKLWFDVDISGQRLAIGDQRGVISLFDLNDEIETILDYDNFEPRSLAPALELGAHNDATGSVAFHPYNSHLLSVSGSRHFEDTESQSSSSDGDEENNEMIPRRRRESQPFPKDSTIKIWNFSKSTECSYESSNTIEHQTVTLEGPAASANA